MRAATNRVAALAVGAVAAALLAGCGLLKPLHPPTPGVAETTESSLRPGYEAYFAQQIAWEECAEEDGLDTVTKSALVEVDYPAGRIRCATVTVPYTWDPTASTPATAGAQVGAGDDIEIRIVRIPGSKPGAKSLFFNPGGPGESGVVGAFGMVSAPDFERVLAEYDLIGFDPRGVGASQPLVCDSAGTEDFAAQLAACVAGNPISHTMGTANVARDMELLRALLGDNELNYLGYSYGTMLGATYATMFPERVGRMVLDSAENGEWATPIHLFEQSLAIAAGKVQMGADCAAGILTECPYETEQQLIELLGLYAAEPLGEVDAAWVDTYLTDTLYTDAAYRLYRLELLADARNGDTELAALLAENAYYLGEQDPAADGDTANPLADEQLDLDLDIVTCHSQPKDLDVDELRAHIYQTEIPELLGGNAAREDLVAQYSDLSCQALPETGQDFIADFRNTSAQPILVLGVTGDHATPYKFAGELVRELGNAQLLTLDGPGHGASYAYRSSCIDNYVTEFLLTGKLPPADAVCYDD